MCQSIICILNFYQVTKEEADKINKAKQAGGRIVCVGTTSCRTIESAADENGVLKTGTGRYRYFHLSGYSFKMMDVLITNFHLPESTLLMLVFCTCRKRAGYACVRRSSAGEIPVLLVWRCDDYIGRLVRDFYGKRKRYYSFNNPRAGKGTLRNKLADIIDMMMKRQWDVSIAATQKAGDAVEYIIQKGIGCDRVIMQRRRWYTA